MKRYIIAFVVSFFAILTYAQSNINDLIVGHVQQRVKQVNDYIAYMADNGRPIEDRKEYRNLALNLFIGHGEPYIVNGASREGVYMRITSKYRKRPIQRLMKDYFNGLINGRYSKVAIQSIDISYVKVSELKRVSEHEYECTCTFTQAFCGYRDERPVYKDITKKRVTCRITEEEIVKVSTSGDVETVCQYLVLFGDVEALETI